MGYACYSLFEFLLLTAWQIFMDVEKKFMVPHNFSNSTCTPPPEKVS